MPANKYALLRYRIIDRCIRNKYKTFPSKSDLREACEEALYGNGANRVSESTIEKDIYALRNEENLGYFAPIKFSKLEGGYYYEDSNYSIEKLPVSEEELDALNLAVHTLNQFKELQIFDGFESTIERIMNLYNAGIDDENSNIIQFEKGVVVGGAEHIPTLIKVIKNKQIVNFKYYSFWRKTTRTMKFAPLILREYKNRWYILGHSVTHDEERTFALDRISDIEILDGNHNYKVSGFKEQVIGIIGGNNPPLKIILAFDDFMGEYLNTLPLHKSQLLIEKNDRGFIFEYLMELTPELTHEILSYGPEVEVIEPKELKLEIKNLLKAALKKY